MSNFTNLFKLFEKHACVYGISPFKPSIKYVEDLTHCHSYPYSDILVNSNKVFNTLLQNYGMCDNNNIGVFLSSTCPSIVPVILGIHKREDSFICIDPNSEAKLISHIFEKLDLQYFFCLNDYALDDSYTILETISVFGRDVNLVKVPSRKNLISRRQVQKDNRIAYHVLTSGSTGEPKIVSVTHHCINSNIASLISKYSITHDDRIYCGTPATFDPFLVDLYMAITSGVCLLMTSCSIKYDLNHLGEVLFKSEIPATIIQLTPSVFFLWSSLYIKENILREASNLRILALGGEKIPNLKSLVAIKCKGNMTRVFNLYGITELSSWSTIQEVFFNNLGNEMEIPLGHCLQDTLLDIKYNRNIESKTGERLGELYVGSFKRKCILEGELISDILAEKIPLYRRTGDLVAVRGGKIYYAGRSNDTIKRYGQFINLNSIEERVNQCCYVKQSSCVWSEELKHLCLFYKAHIHMKYEIRKKVFSFIKAHLKDIELPDYIYVKKTLALSKHGKISKSVLEESHIRKYNKGINIDNIDCVFNIFKEELSCIDMNLDFISLGGSSINAMQIKNKLESSLNYSVPDVLPLLLDNKTSLLECIQFVKGQGNQIPNSANLNISVSNLWSYELSKCIDATPTHFYNETTKTDFISVGCHSHELITINADTKKLISRIKLPDRIESSVTYAKGVYAVVGCYDGYLYCFNYVDGSIRWKYKTGEMIKSKALYHNSKVIVTSYDKCLHCVDFETGNCLWKTEVATKGLLANPCRTDRVPNRIFCAALDGTVASIAEDTGKIIWKKVFPHPIFSSPCIADGTNEILLVVAEVSGMLRFIDTHGREFWNYDTKGSIFSSIKYNYHNGEQFIFFGSHTLKCVFCIKIKRSAPPVVKWKREMGTYVYASPYIFIYNSGQYVVAATTAGHVKFISVQSGEIKCEEFIRGEIFSSPIVYLNNVFVGCRNNHLYCLNFNFNS